MLSDGGNQNFELLIFVPKLSNRMVGELHNDSQANIKEKKGVCSFGKNSKSMNAGKTAKEKKKGKGRRRQKGMKNIKTIGIKESEKIQASIT